MQIFTNIHYDIRTKFTDDPLIKQLAHIKFDAYKKLGVPTKDNDFKNHIRSIREYLFKKDNPNLIETVLTVDKQRAWFCNINQVHRIQ